MKKYFFISVYVLLINCLYSIDVVRINQIGYMPHSPKIAVFMSDKKVAHNNFQLVNCLTEREVYKGNTSGYDASVWGMETAYKLDFSEFKMTGGYYIVIGNIKSPCFRIDYDIYEGTADIILNYMRQQRCGFNPFFNDSCHVHDGIIVDHPSKSGEYIDVTGGWHDASDYLQYLTTSANATYQMMYAFSQNPEVYADFHLSNGLKGENGIPDILDEIRWGLEWMMKMNPSKNEMYNQIADDRDHRGFRIPTLDTVSYGLGNARPVYFVTGKPQGLGKYKNRSTGVASTAAKYTSAFAFGAEIFRNIDPQFSAAMAAKAVDAWEFSKSDPGVNQTACNVSPYFYEEDNYVDDMELAAVSLFKFTGNTDFLNKAKYWGELEPVTPWMEIHRARHYQFYPFVNLGHSIIAATRDSSISNQFISYYKKGLEEIERYAKDDPFNIGIPFQWCSSNFMAAAATQAQLYRRISGDGSFIKMEFALYDWLLGCNPWGTSMICGFPAGGDYPEDPHSAITLEMGEITYGGLVDGPVYKSIYESLKGIRLFEEDEYSKFQGGRAVYHDDIGDYSSNEPTMDGTASLSYILSSLEKEGKHNTQVQTTVKDAQGAIIRSDTASKTVFLIFSAHEFNDGAKHILKTLKKAKIKASFFMTGDFYRNPENAGIIHHMIEDGHYLGAHSDKHLLYNDWNRRDSLLVSRDAFEKDLKENFKIMGTFGIKTEEAAFFLPPFEWYNSAVVDWSRQMGLNVINFTPGIRTNADYTTPEMDNYRSSKKIIDDLKKYIEKDENALNGNIILIHLGTHPDRKDKLYTKLDQIISLISSKGFKFKSL